MLIQLLDRHWLSLWSSVSVKVIVWPLPWFASIKSLTIQGCTWFTCELKNIFDLIGYAEGCSICATLVFTLCEDFITFRKCADSLPFTSFLISGCLALVALLGLHWILCAHLVCVGSLRRKKPYLESVYGRLPSHMRTSWRQLWSSSRRTLIQLLDRHWLYLFFSVSIKVMVWPSTWIWLASRAWPFNFSTWFYLRTQEHLRSYRLRWRLFGICATLVFTLYVKTWSRFGESFFRLAVHIFLDFWPVRCWRCYWDFVRVLVHTWFVWEACVVRSLIRNLCMAVFLHICGQVCASFWSWRRMLIQLLDRHWLLTWSSVSVKVMVCPSTFDLASIKSLTIQGRTWFTCRTQEHLRSYLLRWRLASCATVVFTLYVKTWSRFTRASSALPFTSFLISGSSGVGGVTGTSFEPAHLVCVACVISSLIRICVRPSSSHMQHKFAPALILARMLIQLLDRHWLSLGLL